jgi:hypothetical protein
VRLRRAERRERRVVPLHGHQRDQFRAAGEERRLRHDRRGVHRHVRGADGDLLQRRRLRPEQAPGSVGWTRVGGHVREWGTMSTSRSPASATSPKSKGRGALWNRGASG